MEAELIGYLVGIIVVSAAVGIGLVYLGGQVVKRRPAEDRAGVRRIFNIAAVVVSLAIIAIGIMGTVGQLRPGNTIAAIRMGMERGCTNRCVTRTKQEDACKLKSQYKCAPSEHHYCEPRNSALSRNIERGNGYPHTHEDREADHGS